MVVPFNGEILESVAEQIVEPNGLTFFTLFTQTQKPGKSHLKCLRITRSKYSHARVTGPMVAGAGVSLQLQRTFPI